MINIKDTFIRLTSKLYPRETETEVIELFPKMNLNIDEFGNYYHIIKKADGSFSDVMFTSHLDTVNRGYANLTDEYENGVYTNSLGHKRHKRDVVHIFDGDFIKTDGETNLGADDKAGVCIMLNMINENILGLYYFFIGEEHGGIGSNQLAKVFKDKMIEHIIPKINKCISFDRRGYDSIITFMRSDCASVEFAKSLADKLNVYGFWFKPDNTGLYTDSYEFINIIPECTNISVGYFNEHQLTEKQDIEFLSLLAVVVTKIDWDSLPIVRKLTKPIDRNDYNFFDDEPDYVND
jgi:hypothetical protein